MLEKRYCTDASLALTAVLATTQSAAGLDISNYAWGQVYVPTGSSITSLTYYVSKNLNGTYIAAYDSAGAAIVQTVAAARAYPIPAALFGAPAIKIVSDATGNVGISLKS